MASLLRRVARDSHLISRTAGDAEALRTGDVPKLAKRVGRRWLVRSIMRRLPR